MKKILLSVLMFSVLVFGMGAVSAATHTYDNEAADYARITHDVNHAIEDVTPEVAFDDGVFATLDDNEELQGKWNHNIPSNAIIDNVKVHIKAKEKVAEIELNIQLWSANKEKSLTEYQALGPSWEVLEFSDDNLIREIQDKVSAGLPIKIEADFSDPINGAAGDNTEAKVDYMWLEVTYTVDEESPTVSIIKDTENPTCDDGVKITATANDRSDLASFNLVCGNSVKKSTTNAAVNGNSAILSDTLSVPSYTPELLFDNSLVTCTATAKDKYGNEKVETFTYKYDCEAPSVSINDIDATEGQPITFSATATDSVDSSLDYKWFIDNTEISFPYTFSENGSYSVKVEVVDDAGHVGIATKNINVLDVNPTAGFSVSSNPIEGQEVTFTSTSMGHKSDEITKYEWTINGIVTEETTGTIKYTFNQNNNYIVSLRVYDEDSWSTNDASQTIEVADTHPTAVSAGDAEDVVEGTLVSFTGSATLGEDSSLEWLWTFEDGQTSTKQNPTYTFAQQGVYNVEMKVKDNDDDAWQTANVIITVADTHPTAVSAGDAQTVVEGTLVSFTGSATLGEDSSLEWLWTFEDGQTSTKQNPTYTFAQQGVYNVEMKVKDNDDDEWQVANVVITVFDYSISLNEGWNLISIPLVAENETVESVFSSVKLDIEKVWSYTWDGTKNVWEYTEIENGEWTNANFKIVPGYGYYVLMKDNNDEVKDTFELFLNGEKTYMIGEEDESQSPVIGIPPQVTLAMNSWNLIGVFGQGNLDKHYALKSLTDQDDDQYYDILYTSEGEKTSSLTSTKGYWLSMKLIEALTSIEYKANYDIWDENSGDCNDGPGCFEPRL